MPTERRLAAIMFTDIVGYTALMARDEEAGRRARDRHEAVVRPLVERYGGQWIERTGDETLSSFPSALDAVNCALAAQAELDGDPELQLRIGIHHGDVTFDAAGVSGDGVNVAARVRPLARPGGICVTGDVHHSVRARPELRFEALGEQDFKNVDHPVPVFAVSGTAEPPRPVSESGLAARPRTFPLAAWGVAAVIAIMIAAGWWLYDPATADPILTSIAVLPLANIGPADQEYVADGVTDALIESLARVGRELRVISRTSVMQYKGTTKPAPEIAAELGVVYLIEGTAQRQDDRILIRVQLIDGGRDEHLWVQSFERDLQDFFAVQREIARKVAGEIHVALRPDGEALQASTRSVDPEALDAYLRASHHLSRLTIPDLWHAVELFGTALEIEPAFLRVREAATRAVELDGSLAQAHALLANARWRMDLDWTAAESAFRRALEIDPTNSEVQRSLAYLLSAAGRHSEAIELSERALAVDPANLHARMDYGYALHMGRRFERVLEEAERMLAINGDFAKAYDLLFTAHAALGDEEAAYRAFHRYERLVGVPQWHSDACQRGYEQGGFRGCTRLVLLEARERDWAGPFVRAILACFAGEPDEALAELERADSLDPTMLMAGTYPTIDCARDDPRFDAVLRRINWPGLDSE
jgi:TolB-like protein/class 3 adenylate cyclase